MTVMDVSPAPAEVAVVNLPPGTTARVHHAHGVREYQGVSPDMATVVVAVGDVGLLGWGAPGVVYLSLQQVRNGRHRLDRDVWHQAIRLIQRGGGVAYVQHEQRDYYGKPRWTAIGVRAEDAVTR
jgi:hypothetical protein